MASGKGNPAQEGRWREMVGRQAASGLSVRAFCRQEGLREPSFYYWRRAIRRRDAGPPPAAAFVPAVVRAAEPRAASILVAWEAGPRLSVTISATWVAELLRAVTAGGGR